VGTSRAATPAGPLVSWAQLAEELRSQAPPTVLDVRWSLAGPPGRDDWIAGHIPGAAHVDIDTALSAPPGPAGRHPLPDPQTFAAAMRAAGVSSDRGVVVYDAEGALSSARAWWLLRFHGHSTVRVLDGGLRAWTEAGQPLEAGDTRVDPGDFTASAAGGALPVVDAAGAQAIARRGVLLDVRAAERYRGEVEPIDPVAGHIPGALSAPATANLDPATGRFLPAARLADQFAALGAVRGAEVAAYCGSGVNAAQAVLALSLAGVPAALYVGSWSNWVADEARPVATGAEPG
jgi:thiosulfate/3-mercaptopyruvate sulfurtransferase